MQTFSLTHEHITLLRGAKVSHNGGVETGTAGLDLRHPYGGGYMHDKMARLLGIKDVMSAELRTRMDKLHNEMATALQIILATGAFEVGVYEADDYRRNWRAV